MAAEDLKSMLSTLGLQTGREFPTVAVITGKLDEINAAMLSNHKLLSKRIQSEVGRNYAYLFSCSLIVSYGYGIIYQS